jgi:hypothetical protein
MHRGRQPERNATGRIAASVEAICRSGLSSCPHRSSWKEAARIPPLVPVVNADDRVRPFRSRSTPDAPRLSGERAQQQGTHNRSSHAEISGGGGI